MTTSEIGRLGENAAVKALKKEKYKIIDQNVHFSHNEIDIIAKNKKYLVFVEVKTRSCDENMQFNFGSPASAVDLHKQKRTIAAAREFIKHKKFLKLQPRFDVIEVFLSKETQKPIHINHIENAFGA